MDAPNPLREQPQDALPRPVVVTFFVPPGLSPAGCRRLIDGWYDVIGVYSFVYLGGTSFALNLSGPSAEALRTHLGDAAVIEGLSPGPHPVELETALAA